MINRPGRGGRSSPLSLLCPLLTTVNSLVCSLLEITCNAHTEMCGKRIAVFSRSVVSDSLRPHGL